ncbi:hypothetical protein LBMAG52_15550 [Planctomycetia bacterium]|nr:hypothetical protein LBMAG52_15550 [Planctomycetia bacterium]
MPSRSCLAHRRLSFLLLMSLHIGLDVDAAEPFQDTVLPFVKTYCVECHNAKKTEGELDLTRYSSAEKVAADYRKWEHVVTFVTKEEMPPPDAKQPTPAERAKVLGVLGKLMLQEARKTAGDPGVVLPRRLSNAEYNYAIRDLTGVDIRPADSFPIDPASGEGFSNTGEALVMSPNLFKKYYAAAQHVADHVLLTPTRMEFAPHPVVTFADQKKLTEQAILNFYERHKVDEATYLTAAWQYRHRLESRRAVTVEDWATERQLSPKYFRSLWNMLTNETATDQFLLAEVRRRFNALPNPADGRGPFPPAEIVSLAKDIRRLSQQLCLPETEAIVGNAGNAPVQHIDRRTKTAENRDTFNPGAVTDSRRLHAEVTIAADKPVTIVVRVGSVGDATDEGYVILKGMNFSVSAPTQYKPNDPTKNLSLRTLLSEHAPEELKRLNWGTHPLGQAVDADCLVLKVPSSVTIEVPAKALGEAKHKHVYAEAALDRANSKAGIASVYVAESRSDAAASLPLINPEHAIAKNFAASGEAFCKLFPNRFYFADETRGLSAGFHLIEGFFRDDQPLCKLVLSDAENRELDRLWDELYFVTGVTEKMLRGFVFFERSERNFMKHPDFDSIKEEDPELTSDGTLNRFEQIYLNRSGVKGSAEEVEKHPVHTFFEEFRQGLKRRATQWQAAVPAYQQRLMQFAQAAYRRPLTKAEQQKLTQFFNDAAKPESLGIEQAVRATVVRILVSPNFCYLADAVPPGETVKPLSDLALASRLSFFLWSSVPDAELRTLAEAGQLNNDATLKAQTRRMLKDSKVSGFALEFFGQWLNYRDFRQAEAVNRSVFPAFDDPLKQAMFEEPTRLATHVLQNDLAITELLRSDTTFVNKRLAQHYGLPFDGPADEWRLTTGLHQQGRGGLLGMAVFLTKNSQPQRTSPVKRGFWVVHKLLGEHIPPPPPDVAVLPAKETDTDGKTIRQLLTAHTEDMKCARCHVRFDPIGLAMEGFDSIGRSRAKDLAGRAIDNVVQLPTGEQARGVSEFSEYLAKHRRTDFTTTLNRKLLGYALGRSLQLSDLVFLEKLEATLQETDYRVVPLFEAVVTSPVFRNQRCRDFVTP